MTHDEDDHFIAGTWAAFDSFKNLVHAQCLTTVFSSGPVGVLLVMRVETEERERELWERDCLITT